MLRRKFVHEMGLGDGDGGDELGGYYPSSSQNNYGRVIEQSAQHEEEGEEPYVISHPCRLSV